MYRILLLLCFLLSFRNVVDLPTKKSLIVGVNGHPFNQKDYLNISFDEQIALIKEMHLSMYRVDINPYTNGLVREKFKFLELIEKAGQNGVKLLPMLYLTGFNFHLLDDICYKKGFDLGVGFGSNYGKYFDYYELGNELELQKELSSNSGSREEDYSLPNMKKLAIFLKGMDEGLKKSDPGCKTIINCGGWFHFVYLEMLQKLGVNFDITGYHWYSDMDDYAKSVNINIIDILSERLNKPIWFTEVNYVSKSFYSSSFETRRKEWISNFIQRSTASNLVEAVLIYELIDQPNLQNNPESEKKFGLVKRNNFSIKKSGIDISKNGKWIFKESANTLKKLR